MYIKEMEILKFLKMIKMYSHLACIVKLIIQQKNQIATLDVELEENLEDKDYLEILKNNLLKLNKMNFDFVFYIAGVDVHYQDKLGKLKLTDDGINQRDKTVIDNFFSKKYLYVVFLEVDIIKTLINL